jgi:hypothetical protein
MPKRTYRGASSTAAWFRGHNKKHYINAAMNRVTKPKHRAISGKYLRQEFRIMCMQVTSMVVDNREPMDEGCQPSPPHNGLMQQHGKLLWLRKLQTEGLHSIANWLQNYSFNALLYGLV